MKTALVESTFMTAFLFLIITAFVVVALYPDHLPLACASLALLGCALWLTQKMTSLLDWKRPSITGVFYLYFLLTLFIPSFFVFAEQDEPYRSRFIFAIESILLTIPLGILAASRLFRFRKEDLHSYLDRSLEPPNPRDVSSGAFLILLALALGVTARYCSEVREIPLFYIFRNPGEYLAAAELRYDSLLGLESSLRYVYFVTRDMLYPFLVLVAFGRFLHLRTRKWAVLFGVALASAVMYASLSIQKAPVAVLFFLLVVYYLVYQRRIVSKKLLIFGLICVIVFPIVVVQVLEPEAGLSGALSSIARRVFYGPCEVLYFYFEVFPDKHPFLYARSIGKLAWLTGQASFDTPNYVGLYGYPESPEFIHANAPFIGDLNAGFGLAGVLFGGIAAGFIMQTIQVYIARKRKTVENLAVFVFEIYGLLLLNHTALPTILASYGVVPVLGLAWALRRIEGS